MRKTVLLIVVAFAMVFSGCQKEDGPDLGQILVGDWTLEMYVPVTRSVKIGDEPIDVTVAFRSDNSFTLSQKVGQAFTQTFQGTWSLDGTTLSGIYSDKKPWGSRYEITFRDNDNTLEMKTVAVGETYVYQRVIAKE